MLKMITNLIINAADYIGKTIAKATCKVTEKVVKFVKRNDIEAIKENETMLEEEKLEKLEEIEHEVKTTAKVAGAVAHILCFFQALYYIISIQLVFKLFLFAIVIELAFIMYKVIYVALNYFNNKNLAF